MEFAQPKWTSTPNRSRSYYKKKVAKRCRVSLPGRTRVSDQHMIRVVVVSVVKVWFQGLSFPPRPTP
jgi:hypothetical protein